MKTTLQSVQISTRQMVIVLCLATLTLKSARCASLLTSASSAEQKQLSATSSAPSASASPTDKNSSELKLSNQSSSGKKESEDSPALSRPKGIDNLGRLEFNDILPDDKYQYDKMRPPKYKGEATQVFFHVTVMTLDSIDESSMTYAADIFFAQSWRDQRLRFNQKMNNQSGHYRLLPVHWLKDIWHPDSYFKNAKQVTFQEMTIPNHYVWLYNDNSLLYMVKLTLVLSCAMSFQYYPHDTQQCSMKIESLSHTTDDLMFLWDPNVPLEVDPIELPQLDLVSNTTGDCTHIYATGSFSCVEVVFTFKRRLGYYLFHTYIPTCLIVIMSWISFWIRPEAVPARVTLGVTSLLTLSTQHANSQKSLPPVSYIKAIDVFMNACTVFVFLSLLEYAIVNVIMGDLVDADESLSRRQGRGSGAGRRRASNRHRMRPLNSFKSRDGNSSGMATCRGAGGAAVEAEMVALDAGSLHNGVLISAALPPAAAFGNDLSQARRHRAILVDKVSRVLFPLAFIILNTIYWMLFYNGAGNTHISH